MILAIVNIKILLLNLSFLITFAFIYLFVIRRKIIQLNLNRYKTNLNFLSILQDTFRSLKDIKVLQKEKYYILIGLMGYYWFLKRNKSFFFLKIGINPLTRLI